MTTTISNNEAANRYELHVDGELAAVAGYTLQTNSIALVHTKVEPEFAGTGRAKQLIAEVLADARRRDLEVLPYCPFVASFIGKNAGTCLD
ncbi:MAG: GNAT family N-acetyltransferase, partial [Actinomycetes bacterium]